jgi:hypothetical protein
VSSRSTPSPIASGRTTIIVKSIPPRSPFPSPWREFSREQYPLPSFSRERQPALAGPEHDSPPPRLLLTGFGVPHAHPHPRPAW